MRVVHVLRKPLSEGTVAANTLRHGCGGLHIAVSRIFTGDTLDGGAYAENPTHRAGEDMWTRDRKGDTNCFKRGGAGHYEQPAGRWPANVILQHLDGCRCGGVKRVKGSPKTYVRKAPGKNRTAYSEGVGQDAGVTSLNYADTDGKETVANWICAPECPVKALDEQSGTSKSTGGRIANISTTSTIYGGGKGLGQALSSEEVRGDPGFGDTGGASRFFKQVGGSDE